MPLSRKSLIGNLMMTFSIVVVCMVVPSAFILGGSFSRWLENIGVHQAPEISGGAPVAAFDRFDREILEPVPGLPAEVMERALAIKRFEVRKVAFRRFSGLGIKPRLNLVFEFEGRLPDPQHSANQFSSTVIHVYVTPPGPPRAVTGSDKTANVDFGGEAWKYQVIVDGFHDQARIFDGQGNLVARGLGLYTDYVYDGARQENGGKRVVRTLVTAALPMDVVGDPARGDWRYFVLVGLADSRVPSMMLHSPLDGRLCIYSRAVRAPEDLVNEDSGKRLFLPPLSVSNRR